MKQDSGVLLRQLTGHSNFVGSLAAMPDNRTFVSSSEDGTIRVWDLHTGACPQVIRGHENAVNCIALSADGTRLVSASDDHSIKVWNTMDPGDGGPCGVVWPRSSPCRR